MKIFIGSAKESVNKAIMIKELIESNSPHEAFVWESLTWTSGEYTLDFLLRQFRRYDAAVFVYSEDDTTWYREKEIRSVRDNVIFESGLFYGMHGRSNVCLFRDKNANLPTDLLGLTYLPSKKERKDIKLSLVNWLDNVVQMTEKLDLRANIDKDMILFEYWENVKNVTLVNFAASTFTLSSTLEARYRQEIRELYLRKVEEGTNFNFLLTSPGSYADYDAYKYKMKIKSHQIQKIISNSVRKLLQDVNQNTERRKSNKNLGKITCRVTDVVLPYALMMSEFDDEYSYKNSIKIDLYVPGIFDDRKRPSFRCYQGDAWFDFFSETITELWGRHSNAPFLEKVEIIHDVFCSYPNKVITKHEYDTEFKSDFKTNIYNDEIFFVGSGQIELYYNDVNIFISKNGLVKIPKQTAFSYKAVPGTQILCLKVPFKENHYLEENAENEY